MNQVITVADVVIRACCSCPAFRRCEILFGILPDDPPCPPDSRERRLACINPEKGEGREDERTVSG